MRLPISIYPYKNIEDFNLDYLQKKLDELGVKNNTFSEWITQHETEYEELKALYDAVMSGDFPQSIKDAFSSWMQDNAIDLVGELVHMVFFGLTDDGYFVAYIPEGWDDIQFGTSGLDTIISGVEYGRLILSY